MDLIDTTLTNQIRDESKYDHAVRTSLARGKKLLNRYYKISDMSATYRLALSKCRMPRARVPSLTVCSVASFVQGSILQGRRMAIVLDQGGPGNAPGGVRPIVQGHRRRRCPRACPRGCRELVVRG